MLRKLERNDEHGGQAKVTNEDVLVRFILASQSPEIATLSRFISPTSLISANAEYFLRPSRPIIILHAAVIPFADVFSFCFTTKRSLLQHFYVINDGRGKDLRMIPRMHIHLLHSLALLPSKVLIRPNHNSFWVKFFVI